MSRSGTRLSVYNGDLISAQESWLHFTKEVHCDSIGVLAVTVGECATQDLKAYPDTKDFLEHAVIDFRDLTWGQMERKAKKLYNYALRRGWCFRPDFG